MALHLNASSSLEHLATSLASNMNGHDKSVFDPHFIVTQTEGMNNWLKMQIADKIGIAANCRFLKPVDLINEVFYILGGTFPQTLSTTNLTWLLFKVLGGRDFTVRFPSIASYYLSNSLDKDVKRLALAEKMADLFDQYQIYRPAMMRDWNNTVPANTEGSDWQQYLWAASKEASRMELPDKTFIGDFILKGLKEGTNRDALQARMPELHLFGLSIITDYHIQILHELSGVIDVHFHILNPAPSVYWYEDKSEKQLAVWRLKGLKDLDGATVGNALLTGWGRVVQDTFGMFFKHEEFLNAYKEPDDAEPPAETLLQKIQHDIFYAATDGRNPISAENISDGSITISDCYTIAREVEVLYNYLVHLVDQRGAALSPRDIVVMVSDVDAYAPYIKAVFTNSPNQFKFTIADESFAGGDNLFEALSAVLRITEDGFKAEEVLQLLDLSYIRRRFGINDVTGLRHLVNAANIRFGIEGDTTDDTRFVSWRYGIKRIMYGICMSGEPAYGGADDYFFPLDILEGAGAQDAVRFCHFVEVLIDSVESRRAPRNVAEWVLYIERVLHDLIYEPGDEADEQYNTLVKNLSDYNAVAEWMSENVAYEVFNRSFLQSLADQARSGLYATGGITFCSLIPMRSIPFKVVAMLGMTHDKFPRRDKAASFNLMTKDPKRGDRSMKENDKHLFLETVLSARQYLYISYLGRSAKDNGILPPSALVDELLDYIESGVGVEEGIDVRGSLIVQHPLHSFSNKYNSGDPRHYNYLGNVRAGQSIIKDQPISTPPTFEEIRIDQLIRFFKNPFKAYYNKTLGIHYSDEENLLRDTELFDLDTLQQWTFKNQLLKLDEGAIALLKNKAVRTGDLPLANMANVALTEIKEKVAPVRLLYDQYVTADPA